MTTADEHKSKWLHNRRFAGTISDEYPDWMVIALFYAAVQAVETVFAHDMTRVHSSHTARNQTLKSVQRYRKIWTHYRPLFDAARTARYEVGDSSNFTIEDVKDKLAPHLYQIESSVRKLIPATGQLEQVWKS